ncbi:MAG: hypothetical protein PV344_03575 [Anaplasma sp.]|nr:hypothetical protein [Anaplasma sp.]
MQYCQVLRLGFCVFGIYCKRLNFRGLKFSRIGPKLKICNYSRVLIFANRMYLL